MEATANAADIAGTAVIGAIVLRRIVRDDQQGRLRLLRPGHHLHHHGLGADRWSGP